MLVKCKECNNDISSQAKSCPQCGAPLTKKSGHEKSGEKIGKWLVILCAVVVIPLALSEIIVGKNQSVNNPATAPKQITIDFMKPLFTTHGSVLCNTEDNYKALKTIIASGEKATFGNAIGCMPVQEGSKVIWLSSGGFMTWREHVRVILPSGKGIDGWISTYNLKN